jgi:hypothetical protein
MDLPANRYRSDDRNVSDHPEENHCLRVEKTPSAGKELDKELNKDTNLVKKVI